MAHEEILPNATKPQTHQWRLITPAANWDGITDAFACLERRDGGIGTYFSPVEKELTPLDSCVCGVMEWVAAQLLRRRRDLDIAIWLETVPLSPQQSLWNSVSSFVADSIRPTLYAAARCLLHDEKHRQNVALCFDMDKHFGLSAWPGETRDAVLRYLHHLNTYDYLRFGEALLAEEGKRDLTLKYQERPKVDWVRSIDRVWAHVRLAPTANPLCWAARTGRKGASQERDQEQWDEVDREIEPHLVEVQAAIEKNQIAVIHGPRREHNIVFARRVMRQWPYHCNYEINCRVAEIATWSELLRAMCEAVGASLTEGDDVEDFLSVIGDKPFRLFVSCLDHMSVRDQREAVVELAALMKRLHARQAPRRGTAPGSCVLITSSTGYAGVNSTRFDGIEKPVPDSLPDTDKAAESATDMRSRSAYPELEPLFLLFPGGAGARTLRWMVREEKRIQRREQEKQQRQAEADSGKRADTPPPAQAYPPNWRAFERSRRTVEIETALFKEGAIHADEWGRIRPAKFLNINSKIDPESTRSAAAHLWAILERRVRVLRPRPPQTLDATPQTRDANDELLRTIRHALQYADEEAANLRECVLRLWQNLAAASDGKVLKFDTFEKDMKRILKLTNALGRCYAETGIPTRMGAASWRYSSELFMYGVHAAESLFQCAAARENAIVITPAGDPVIVAPFTGTSQQTVSIKRSAMQSAALSHYHSANLFYLRAEYSDARRCYLLALNQLLTANNFPQRTATQRLDKLDSNTLAHILEEMGSKTAPLPPESLWAARIILGLAACFRKQDVTSISNKFLSKLQGQLGQWKNLLEKWKSHISDDRSRRAAQTALDQIALELAHCRRHQASIYRRKGNLEAAFGMLEAAMKEYERLGAVLPHAECQQLLGDARRWLGSPDAYKDAMFQLGEARRKFQTAGLHQHTAHVQRALGEIALMRDDQETALRLYADAMERYYQYANSQGQARLLRLRAQACRVKALKLKDDAHLQKAVEWAKAQRYLDRSLALYSGAQVRSGVGRTRKNFGDLMRDRELHDLAASYYLAAVQTLHQHTDFLYKAEALRGWGISCLKQGDYISARQKLEEAASAFKTAKAAHYDKLCQRDLKACRHEEIMNAIRVSILGAIEVSTLAASELNEIREEVVRLGDEFVLIDDRSAKKTCDKIVNKMSESIDTLLASCI